MRASAIFEMEGLELAANCPPVVLTTTPNTCAKPVTALPLMAFSSDWRVVSLPPPTALKRVLVGKFG